MSALEAGIVEWVNTFDISSPCSGLSELADGVALSEVLLEISPGLFDPDAIKRDVGDNWALKLTNVKKVFFNLQTFYREILGREVLDPPALDITRVARESSPEGIRALVQLLVGAAVSCGGKANYIQAIMQMSVEGQATMQQVVQEAMAGMVAPGDEGMADKEHAVTDGEAGPGRVANHGPGARGDGGGEIALVPSVSGVREEAWAQRLAEAEETVGHIEIADNRIPRVPSSMFRQGITGLESTELVECLYVARCSSAADFMNALVIENMEISSAFLPPQKYDAEEAGGEDVLSELQEVEVERDGQHRC